MIQWVAASLLCLGVVMVTSAGLMVDNRDFDHMMFLQSRPVIYAAVAMITLYVISFVDIRQLTLCRGRTNVVGWMLAITIVLCVLVLIPGIGKEVNYARRWLPLGPISFQPSELAKWIMVLAIARWCSRHAGAMPTFFSGLIPPLMVTGVFVMLTAKEDLGTAALMGMVGLGMVVAAGAKLWHVLIPTGVGGGGGSYMIVSTEYRWNRWTAFLNPWDDPEGTGYHPIRSMVSIASGDVEGKGLGNGLQKMGYLPEDTTDFIFAVICEELGVLGAILVVCLYITLLWAGLRIVLSCRFPFGRLLGCGIILTVGLQAIINLAVVTVMMPTKGIALPLLSNGGTGWVLTAAFLGLLVATDRLNLLAESDSQTTESSDEGTTRSDEPVTTSDRDNTRLTSDVVAAT